MIGVVPTPPLHDDTTVLHPGDILVLYTDGVTEARSRDNTFYGEQRLAERLGASGDDAVAMTEGLLDDVLAFQDGDARDDIAIVTLRVTRPPSRTGGSPV